MTSFHAVYFNWLIDLIFPGSTSSDDPSYRDLFVKLYNTPFAWIISRDKNRMADVEDLRVQFITEAHTRAPAGWMESVASVFEVIIRFCYRANFETDLPIEAWFWEILDNLHLSRFRTVSDNDAREIDDILYRFIWRDYGYDGEGGMFPLKNPESDQSKTEIWAQFHAYLNEKEVMQQT